MRYSYQTNFEFYKLAMRTYIRASASRRFWFHFQMWGMLVLGVLILVFNATTHIFRPGVLMGGVVGGLVGGGAVCPLLRPWQLKRVYKAWNGELQNRTIFLEVNGAELINGVDGRSEARFQRSAVCGTAEDESTLLLFLNKKKFLYVSKTVVPKAALEEVRIWLQLPGAPPSC
jgi:hypothetical protein